MEFPSLHRRALSLTRAVGIEVSRCTDRLASATRPGHSPGAVCATSVCVSVVAALGGELSSATGRFF